MGRDLWDPIIETAILDRVLHHGVTINIKGESYRLKEKRKAGLLKEPVLEQTIVIDLAAKFAPPMRAWARAG